MIEHEGDVLRFYGVQLDSGRKGLSGLARLTVLITTSGRAWVMNPFQEMVIMLDADVARLMSDILAGGVISRDALDLRTRLIDRIDRFLAAEPLVPAAAIPWPARHDIHFPMWVIANHRSFRAATRTARFALMSSWVRDAYIMDPDASELLVIDRNRAVALLAHLRGSDSDDGRQSSIDDLHDHVRDFLSYATRSDAQPVTRCRLGPWGALVRRLRR